MIPFEFFGNVISISKKIQFKLGYFSSNSISTLSHGFAQFIYNGGTIDFLINHFVTEEDYQLINNEIVIDEKFYIKIEKTILDDLNALKNVLTKKQTEHFFNCLRFLMDNGRINFFPVTTKTGEISHYKEALFWDENENIINIVGSCNFTYKGIICNGESFIVNRSWGSDSEKANILEEIKEYDKIFSKKSQDFIYLNSGKLKKIIKDHSKSLSKEELIKEEYDVFEDYIESGVDATKINKVKSKLELQFEEVLETIQNTPHFPKPFKPRPYQETAYQNWVKNNFSGIFGMATGTGKTKTSLNCVLEEYRISKSYYLIILVPSIALLNQWEQEALEFNFQNILKIGGGNNWEHEFSNYSSNYVAGLKKNLLIISTYASFSSSKFQKNFKKIEKDFILIADEAHNIGANSIKSVLKNSKLVKKIALSATPKRIYDYEGTEFLNKFFNDNEPYVFNFSMKQALDEDFLTLYKYYPIIVELSDNELDDYIKISKQLLKYFDFEKGIFKKDPIVEKLLLIRKNIIHKAKNKVTCFKEILLDLQKENKLKYIFTYIPEGYIKDENGESRRMLEDFLYAGREAIPNLTMNTYISDGDNLQDKLRGFSEGKIDLLFAMKMLDEGVDVPRAEVGIFASSTGNPRQFIQRRGRLLRKHDDKPYATIFDMVVIPKLNNDTHEMFTMERNLVKNELMRVGYFASLAMNFYDSKSSLELVCKKYNLDLDTIINEL
ncbi:MAG: DEAD/DEAH box helicase family protein [Weeksellaceae bacterium]|nr:DEAD/DEAH box helicase family protein [Weeksellaceae bacterium]